MKQKKKKICQLRGVGTLMTAKEKEEQQKEKEAPQPSLLSFFFFLSG